FFRQRAQMVLGRTRCRKAESGCDLGARWRHGVGLDVACDPIENLPLAGRETGRRGLRPNGSRSQMSQGLTGPWRHPRSKLDIWNPDYRRYRAAAKIPACLLVNRALRPCVDREVHSNFLRDNRRMPNTVSAFAALCSLLGLFAVADAAWA